MKIEEMLISMHEDSPLPAALLDDNLQTVWLNAVARERYPVLKLPRGVCLLLSPEQNEALEAALENRACFTVPIAATGMEILLQRCGDMWLLQLITSMGWEAGAFDPQGTQRAVATVNANLRGPLARIFSSVNSAAREADSLENERLFEISDDINNASYRLLRFAQSFTDYMRCVYGTASMKKLPFDLTKMLSDLLAAAALMLTKINIPLDIELPQERVFVEADCRAVAMAVMHLVDNSCRYTREGNRITVRLEVKGELARIVVTDRGAGIPADHLSHAVRPFYSWDPDGRPDTGCGLGLTVVQHIAVSHGGALALASTENEGTTASFSMPVIPEPVDDGLSSTPHQLDYLRDAYSPVQVILSDSCGAPKP